MMDLEPILVTLANEAGIHPRLDASPSLGTTHTHLGAI